MAESIAHRVLVVDDEPGIRRIFSVAVANYGFVVHSAGSSLEALRLFEQAPYDVIVTDVHMPSCDGFDFLGLLRSRGIRTPVIVMSGRPSLEGKARALAEGAFCYMIKPIMPSELRIVLESALPRGQSPSAKSTRAARGSSPPRRP